MSCGLKKQNKPGGIHLTERTCSPYNPIIRLMVDDCLGLPVYPVTSIDAVIDEDGNTLRQLLEDLKLEITKGLSIEEITQHIETILSNLNSYVTTELFVSLKDWLLKISSLGDIDPNESEERQSPTIVDEFNSLLDLVNKILDILGISDETDTEDLIDIVTNLKSLVEEIGKCGQLDLRTNGVVWIIEYVTDLLKRVGSIENRAGTGNFAHLNPDINKLDESEYPVTSAVFLIDSRADLPYFAEKVNSLREEESFYVWIKSGIRFGLKASGNDDWPKYDYNDDGIVDFFDVAILTEARLALPGTLPSGKVFDLTEDALIGIADVNALIDVILSNTTSNNTYFATNECSNYIYLIIKPKSTLVFGAAGEITDLTEIPYFRDNNLIIIKKHPVIEGKLYSDTLHDVVYRCKIKNDGNADMIRLTNLVGENEISIDFQNEDNLNLIHVKFTPITCRGNLDDLSVNEYYIENNNGIYLSGVPVNWLLDSTNSNSTLYLYLNISTYALTGGITIVTKYLNHFMEQSVSSISPQHLWNSYQRKRNELINLYNNIAENEETDLRNEILEEIAKIANINTSSETPTLNDEFYRENVRDLIRTRGSLAVASALTYEQEHYISPTPRPVIFGARNDTPSIYKYVGPGDPAAADLYAHDTAIYELKTLDSDETKVAWSKLFSVNDDGIINITDITMLILALMNESKLTRGVASINFSCVLKLKLEDEDRVVTELPIGTHVFDIDNNLEYIVVKPETGKLMLYPSIRLEQFVDDSKLTTEVYMNDNLVDYCSSLLSY